MAAARAPLQPRRIERAVEAQVEAAPPAPPPPHRRPLLAPPPPVVVRPVTFPSLPRSMREDTLQTPGRIRTYRKRCGRADPATGEADAAFDSAAEADPAAAGDARREKARAAARRVEEEARQQREMRNFFGRNK